MSSNNAIAYSIKCLVCGGIRYGSGGLSIYVGDISF